jgi:hypothetical protein
MFAVGSYVYQTIDDARYVYRIVNVDDTHYHVQVPLFKFFGSIFAKWSPIKKMTKKYLNQRATQMDAALTHAYSTLQKGDGVSKLFS